MRDHRIVVALAAATGLAASAAAQFDSGVWPGFRGGATKRASVNADGPAVNLAFRLDQFGTVSPGGFSVAANGDVYFKTHFAGTSKVYRLNAADGSVLAESADFGGVVGNYGGVAIGVDAVYACNFEGAPNSSIIKLNKATLATIAEWTHPSFQGMRGTPLIGSVNNVNGNKNLYVHDRNATKIFAVDSVTGAVMWEYTPIYTTTLSQIGPMWRTAGGRDAFAYFGNGDLGPGAAIQDNGDNTFTVLWDATGPGNFNWWGSGTLSADGDNIYVTTFNDNFTPSLWSISVADGSVVASVPGNRGVCGEEHNFFGRPAAVGNRVYCGGGQGVIACFIDNGSTLDEAWEYRDYRGEHTAISAVRTPGGDVYVYAVKQEVTIPNDIVNDPCGPATIRPFAELIVLKDEGGSYTEVLRTTLNDTMRNTFLSNSSATIGADGGLWVGGGRGDVAPIGDVYKFQVGGACPCACNYDNSTGPNTCDIFDFLEFQNLYAASDPCACNEDISTGPNVCDIFDFLEFQNGYSAGCP